MRELSSVALSGVSKSFGPKRILEDVTVTVGPHTRAGVIGRNGAGKSTLLKIIAGELTPDSGSVVCTPGTTRIGYLRQEHGAQTEETVLQYLERRTGVGAVIAEFESASLGLASSDPNAPDRFDRALDQFEKSGAADFDIRRDRILDEVGSSSHLVGRQMASLSGGQASRVVLGSILLSGFDLLLLDEPTNDLDFHGLEMLEKFCLESSAGMLIVSHDREFLARTTNAIIELDLHDRSATQFSGGWTAYQHEREVRDQHAQQRYNDYQSKRSELTKRAEMQRQWATSGVNKATKNPNDKDKMQRGFFVNKTEKQASKASATERALERLEAVDKPWEGWDLQMHLPEAQRSGDVVFEMNQVQLRRGDFQFGPVDLHIGPGERLAITGSNGSGKSTLLGLLLGSIEPDSGVVVRGPSVKIGDLDQARQRFDTSKSMLEVFMTTTGLDMSEARSLLAKFDLGASMVTEAASLCSSGEQTRAVLASMMAMQTNCIVLDEPSNHLDIDAIEQLEAALSVYGGTVIVVTHDRRMLNSLSVTRQLVVEAGRVISSK